MIMAKRSSRSKAIRGLLRIVPAIFRLVLIAKDGGIDHQQLQFQPAIAARIGAFDVVFEARRNGK